MPVDLNQALADHRQGRIDLAARAYEAAIAEDPDRHEALHLLGIVAFQGGDSRRAITLMGRAIALRPDVAEYHAALAEVHWSLGDLDRAIGGYRESLRLRPDNPAILCNLGATLVDQGNLDTAIGLFREAIRLAPEFAAAHNNLANALQIRGEITLALEHFRLAARFDPASVEAHNHLGKLLLEQGEVDEALIHSLEAVRLDPKFYAARLNLGNVLHTLGRLDEAEASFREAIRLRPDQAAAHACLGGVLEDRGEPERGMASLREALRYDPAHAGALARLASRLREKLPDADRARTEALLSSPSLAPTQRRPLLFGLVQVEDGRGGFDRAAELAAEANALQLVELKAKGRSYSPENHHTFVDRLLEAFSPEFFERVRGWGLDSERPIFVIGMPRSGTSLVEQILASHPRVHGAGELRLVRQTFEAIPGATGHSATIAGALDRLGPDTLKQLAARFLRDLTSLNGTADRIVDKMPENTLYLGLIAALFPRAKVIHCRRDLRDVALSCWLTDFGRVRWASDLDHIASRIAEYRRLMDHWRRVDPIPILDVDYESVVTDLPGMSRAIVAWTGLEWDPACLEFHKTPRPVLTASTAQVRQPIYASSVGRWKNYEQSLRTLFAMLE